MAVAKSNKKRPRAATETAPQPGSFEFLENQLHALDDQAKGHAFEKLCCQFLKHAPTYRNQIKDVWLWKDWPGCWGPDTGIDIIVETVDDKIWAVQAKALRADRTIAKRELDSFLSESNRPEVDFRLLIATTDNIGTNAQRTLEGQEKPVSTVLRGNLLSAELEWAKTLGKPPTKLPPKKPRPHQKAAIQNVAKGFNKNKRGQLIMACGTGKTLTSLWIKERLKSERTLVLVPSLSLVSQTLHEWSRNAKEPFDCLVACSDETVLAKGADSLVTSTGELGIPVTTDADEISSFLRRRNKRPVIVFCTYQSSDRIAEAQSKRTPAFDLVLADEAHRCTGATAGLFATVLDANKIKAKRRLFMTATPRYFSEPARKQAEDRDYELASMDDESQFGPVFHELKFSEAIEKDLLTDYRVVVIGVKEEEARKLAEEAELVRTVDGTEIDARTLASQIGLAKAMRKHDLQKVISFHSSVAKANSFSDPEDEKSLPNVIRQMSRSVRPTGGLWSDHISGKTPAGQRTSLIKHFAKLPAGTRGLLSNCSCLGEGVDVPVLDGVAFIDPKRSQVDIIQAVGRVIRKADDKQLGTIVIPLFLEDTEDADQALSKSAFEPVWRVVCALRAHDETLADELDQLRLNLGRTPRKIKLRLPKKIQIDVPRNLPQGFENAFYVRTVETTTRRQFLPFEEARQFARSLQLKSQNDWNVFVKSGKLLKDIPRSPDYAYKNKGWKSWGDWLGTGNVAPSLRKFRPFNQARKFARSLKLKSGAEWREFTKSGKLPLDVPAYPDSTYNDKGWDGWGDWLDTDNVAPSLRKFRPFNQARKFARSLRLKSQTEWNEFRRSKKRPKDIPTNPYGTYQDNGWKDWGDWLGTGRIANQNKKYRPFNQARKFVRSLKLKSGAEWRAFTKSGKLPLDIPIEPGHVYNEKGWSSMGDWLGTDRIANTNRKYRSFKEARKFARNLNLKSGTQWKKVAQSGALPNDIPARPARVFKGEGWEGWGDWLGTGTKTTRYRVFQRIVFRSFSQARQFARSLKLKNQAEWREFTRSGKLPNDIPVDPSNTYKDQGWTGIRDWLGTEHTLLHRMDFRPFKDARKFVHGLKLKSSTEWRRFLKSGNLPADIPSGPHCRYLNDGWAGWPDWLGYRYREYLPFKQARKFASSLNLTLQKEWHEFAKSEKRPKDIPSNPGKTYADEGWQGFGDWLGTGRIANQNRKYRSFKEARQFARSLNLQSFKEWTEFARSAKRPKDIPAMPYRTYEGKGWKSTGDWLGTGRVANQNKVFRPFVQARKFARTLKLNSKSEWLEFTTSGQLPDDIPTDPYGTYRDKGWAGWTDWRGY